MRVTNPDLYARLSPQLFDLLRQSVLLRLPDDNPQGGRSPDELTMQCLTDIMALGLYDTKEAAHAELAEGFKQNPLVEEVDYDELWKRIAFSADAFPDEIQLFKAFISAINRNEADTVLIPAQARVAYLKQLRGR
ncbi:MAG: hypothetical protein ACRYFX_20800 [Janthinobacterium lividum]